MGGNKSSAFASGVNVKLVTLTTYIIMGVCASTAGVITTSRISASQPNIGIGLETDAIAACVIGGTSFTGGIGSVPGTVVGVLIIGVIYMVLGQAKVDGIIDDYYKMNGNSDPITQNNQLEELIQLGCTDFICIFTEGEGCAPIVDRIAKMGANLVNVDSMASNIDEYEQFVRVNPDNTEAAKMQADYVTYLVDGGGYCILSGISGNMVAQDRHNGVRKVMDENEMWTLLDEQWADWDPEKSVKFTEDWLALYGDDLKAIFCGNDTMAIAAAGACNAAGRDDIVVVGIDAIESAVSMIEHGEMSGTTWQDPKAQGRMAAEALLKLIQGEKVEHLIEVENTLITKDNVDVWYQGQED